MTLIKADSDAKDKSGILCDNIKKMLQGCALRKIEYPIMCSIKRKGMCPIPSPELRVHVDMAMGLVNFFLDLPDG